MAIGFPRTDCDVVPRVVVDGNPALGVRGETGEIHDEPVEAIRTAERVGERSPAIHSRELPQRDENVTPGFEELRASIGQSARIAAERPLCVDAMDDQYLSCHPASTTAVRISR